MQQVSTTHQLRALILSALTLPAIRYGICHATPAQTNTKALLQRNIPYKQQRQPFKIQQLLNKTKLLYLLPLLISNLRSGVVTSPKDIQDVRPYIFSMYQVIFGLLNQLVP